ncbi:uncharacterized protein K02A2.6-like [Lacerta agilis]|uniref:uncharacterized protein K02A2.6-like n=1 Tax=Lacerta agilis TaxID=80427 RepID=UPI001419CC68|nr:uncharacterized protein K02A2.6-like [Lacerta agilis]
MIETNSNAREGSAGNMATRGSIEEFNVNEPGEWSDYCDRLKFYLRANRITSAEERRDTFLSVCGKATFKLAKNLISPATLESKTFEELTAVLGNHFEPAPSQLACRQMFYQRYQQSGESASSFVAALRELTRCCEFHDLEEMLRDRFVCGLCDERLQRELVAKKSLTFQEAYDFVISREGADRTVRELRGGQATGVHAVETDTEEGVSDEVTGGALKVFQSSRRQQGSRQLDHRRLLAQSSPKSCDSCGKAHERRFCRFRNAQCRKCKRMGHIARVCRAGDRVLRDGVERDRETGDRSRERLRCWGSEPEIVGQCSSTRIQPQSDSVRPPPRITKVVRIEGVPCELEVDSGSGFTIVSEPTFRRFCPKAGRDCLRPLDFFLRDFNQNPVPVLGVGDFRVQHRKFKGKLRIVVAGGRRPDLLGRDWFEAFGIRLEGAHRIESAPSSFEALCQEFAAVFDGQLGRYTGPPVSFDLDPAVCPIRLKPRRVPFALKPRIDEELDKLVEQGVLEPVSHARWETPIVCPLKANGAVRICADYKCTLNKALQQNAYPVPVVSHVLASLAGGQIFAKLDLAQAYQQLPVDDATAEAQTIVTHRGAFRVKRLQFGVSVAPGIFQGLMERLLKGIPGVIPYFDDILVAGVSSEELISRLREVLARLAKAGLKVKREKCFLGVPQVEFLGFLVDAKGIHPTSAKVTAIRSAPAPQSKKELQSFLGLLNFYHAFLPHKASIAEPLHRLLDDRGTWKWGQREAAAFAAVKDLLSSDSVLTHFREDLPLSLACDASPYGIGAVLSHRLPDGREAPIAYFSRTLSLAERNYAQIDREALALVAGVKKFHDYVYGRPFELVTDHKPLLGLFAPDRQTPQILSARMLRWAMFLSAYTYELVHRAGKALGHADALSRLPLPEPAEDPSPAYGVMSLEDLPQPPVSVADVAAFSAKDRTLARVLDWVWRGWPEGKVTEEFRPYESRRDELSAHKGCLLWGSRVVIPPKLRQRVLEALHEGHPGIVRMKALARSYVWWPKMDEAIEEWVRKCCPCQESRPAMPQAPVHPWEVTKEPWSRLHVDFAGPFQGQTFLIVVDSHSKWLEVIPVTRMTSGVVIRNLRALFVTHGLPDTLVSDNGAQFTSTEFKDFMDVNGIRHVTSAPFHPSTNGQAERMVRTTKDALRRIVYGDWHQRLSSFLLSQHVTPHSTTGRSPAELLMRRRLTTRLDRLHPDRAADRPQEAIKAPRIFQQGDPVYTKNYGSGPAWIPATVSRPTGPVSYEVEVDGTGSLRRHVDQLRQRWPVQEDELSTREVEQLPGQVNREPAVTHPPEAVEVQMGDREAGPVEAERGTEPRLEVEETQAGGSPRESELRRSQRVRTRPRYLKDFDCGLPTMAERGRRLLLLEQRNQNLVSILRNILPGF